VYADPFEDARGEVKLKTRMMRKIAVLVTGSALALSLPVASSFAEQPTEPNTGQGKHCQNVDKSRSKGKAKGPKKSAPDHGIGWKCGFEKSGLTAVS
jgi:hypothetical protein